MAQADFDLRAEIVGMLLGKVEKDRYPSVTHMDMLEELLSPDEVPVYASILMNKIKEDRFPSTSMLKRLLEL